MYTLAREQINTGTYCMLGWTEMGPGHSSGRVQCPKTKDKAAFSGLLHTALKPRAQLSTFSAEAIASGRVELN